MSDNQAADTIAINPKRQRGTARKHECETCHKKFRSVFALEQHQRDSHGTASFRLRRTGRTVAFVDISIGSVFFAHGRYWTRTDFDAGSELAGSEARGSACNFILDGKMNPKCGPFMYPNEHGVSDLCETCEAVEAVEVEGNSR